MILDDWQRIQSDLRQRVSPENFENWLEPIEFGELSKDGELRLVAPNSASKRWLEEEYRELIRDAARERGGVVQAITFCLPDQPADFNGGSKASPVQHKLPFQRPDTRFNSKYTFSSFVVGSCNEFAHAAAQAVAATPAKSYNPLYIYGGVGMGKTHLMHAIGQHLLALYPQMRVVYVSAEEFMNEMITSIRYDKMTSFHQRFRSADALLVDDVQVLGTRERTQEEFFHTFNALHNMQKQIVISSDLPPKQVPGIVDRLRSRFAWGLMADIQPPDIETKMAILDKKADEAKITLPDKVRTFLATHLKSNIRELEGGLVRLTAVSSVTGSEITLSMAKQALRSLVTDGEGKASVQSIQQAVAEEFGLKLHQLREKSNARAIAYPRQIAMFLTKEMLGLSLPEIGKAFGGKHHTTVLHGVQKIERLLPVDDNLNSLIHKLTDRFN